MNHKWVGTQIAMLRKAKGYTGDKFAELLGVSPQAVSKWETGKCLPETAILAKLAQVLTVTIDQLLVEKKLTILKAVFTDGVTSTDVTNVLNQFILGDHLQIMVSTTSLGILDQRERLGMLLVTYQTPQGVYDTYVLENNYCTINRTSEGITYEGNGELKIVAAYFGTRSEYRDCLQKMKHYEFFHWKEIVIDTESFPSLPETDEIEYLTLVYINEAGIHAISGTEHEVLIYDHGRRQLSLKDTSTCILPGIQRLKFEQGMDCTWAGALLCCVDLYGGELYL